MSPNQLGNAMTRHLMRALMRAAMAVGITRGIDYLARRGKPPEDMTKAEQAQARKTARQSQEAVKRLRQATRITRRLGR